MTAWSLVDVNNASKNCTASIIRVKRKVYYFDVLILVCCVLLAFMLLFHTLSKLYIWIHAHEDVL
jgi:hypothetical protein